MGRFSILSIISHPLFVLMILVTPWSAEAALDDAEAEALFDLCSALRSLPSGGTSVLFTFK